MQKVRQAVFLDRDGTINEDLGYICSKDKLVFIPKAIEALKLLEERFLLFIVTNQSGIGRDLFSEKEFLQFNDYFMDILRGHGIKVEKIYYCPHTKEENCICHKPKTFFLKQAEKDYNIDLLNSYVIGDHPCDIEMAYKVGAGSLYLLTGHGMKHKQELSIMPDYIANDLYGAAVWIMEKAGKQREALNEKNSYNGRNN